MLPMNMRLTLLNLRLQSDMAEDLLNEINNEALEEDTL